MNRRLIACVLLLASCSLVSRPDPKPGASQILISLTAAPKTGIQPPRREPDSGSYADLWDSVEQGTAYQRVDYQRLPDLIVVLSGAQGPTTAPAAATLTAVARRSDLRFDHDQVLVAPGGRLTLRNDTDTTLALFTTSEAWQWFETTLAPGATQTVTVPAGNHALQAEGRESLHATIVAAAQAGVGRSGGEVFFDDLAPGPCTVTVLAPRLPEWRREVVMRPGERLSLEARLTVDDLPQVRTPSR